MYVFEGKPPELKLEQLRQRREKREEATEGLAAAKEAGDTEAIEKYSKRTTKARPPTHASPLPPLPQGGCGRAVLVSAWQRCSYPTPLLHFA